MRERPILFSGPMVRAILDGKKMQTRRVVNSQPNMNESYSHQFPPDGPRTSYGYSGWYPNQFDKKGRHYGSMDHFLAGFPKDFCPYGQPGDRLWVKEGWTGTWHGDRMHLHYKADGGERFTEVPQGYVLPKAAVKPERFVTSLFMPRWASRITLEITDVRVQRLQDISIEDVAAEGVPLIEGLEIADFHDLWDSINAKTHPWSSNPWVWAVSFRRLP